MPLLTRSFPDDIHSPRPHDFSAAVRRAALCVLLTTSLPLFATTLEVPGAFSTIQSAIDAAADGDRIEVGPGTYLETINFAGKDITVIAAAGPFSTFIDAEQSGVVATFESGESSEAILEGFTLTNGQSGFLFTGNGGGLSIVGSSPTIRGNRIVGNITSWAGAGAYVQNGSPRFEGNHFENGTFFCLISDAPCGEGGGIFVENGTVTIENNTFVGNIAPSQGGAIFAGVDANVLITHNQFFENTGGSGGAVLCAPGSTVTSVNNLFVGNVAQGYYTLLGQVDGTAGAVWVQSGASATFRNDTVTENEASGFNGVASGGGVRLDSDTATITQCIFWNNVSPIASQISAVPGVEVVFSSVEGGFPGFANIDADPLFVSGSLGDFYLSQIAAGDPAQSPAVDAGDPALPIISGSTRTDHAPDTGVVDLGFHFGASSFGFRRGDINEDGNRDIGDAVFALAALFQIGAPQPNCEDAMDVNDDSNIDVGDPVFLLTSLFQPGSDPVPPPVNCGSDPSADTLSCTDPECP
ncbi:MAG: right-handed parallel beta-helix repeat-containing protein [Planctomycetota bacterium]